MPSHYKNIFCEICWRPVSLSKKYTKHCNLHSQKNGSSEYKKRRRVLNKIIIHEKRTTTHENAFDILLSKLKSIDYADREITASAKGAEQKNVARYLLTACKEHYPLAYSKLGVLEAQRFNEPNRLGEAVIKAYEKDYPNELAADWMRHCSSLSKSEQRRLILHLFARIQIEMSVLREQQVRGPMIGSVSLNIIIFKDLLKAYDANIKNGERVSFVEIAKKHGVTRQNIHKKWKKLISNPKVYRKAVENQKLK